jgi:mono/diheme cytochrome c family protein
MTHSRAALALVALVPLTLTGCGGEPAAAELVPPAPVTVPSVRYAPRTDLLAITIPEGAPLHWPAPRCPPLRSAQLYPNTPDRDLALDLRKQIGKAILDPTDPSVLTPNQADRIARLVDAHFGTPLVPTVRLPDWDTVVASAVVRLERPDSDKPFPFGASLKGARDRLKSFKWDLWRADWELATAVRTDLKLDDATLARGSIVYRRWCMQCHGQSGAGEPAQAIDNGPAPRDYRQGIFKYTTAFPPPSLPKKGLGAVGKARRTDLLRTVRNGIDGTIMPAFPALTGAELEDVVSYVIHLSVRGETEFATLAKITNLAKLTDVDPDYVGGELDWLFVQNQLWVLLNWGVAAKHPIPVPPEQFATGPERIRSALRGYRLYNDLDPKYENQTDPKLKFGCASCHADYGRTRQLKWDAWATVVQPRNLTLGVFRGGRRGEDLYARLYGGIAPSGMTAFQDQLAKAPPGTPNPLWDIVHFVQALSDPADRRRMKELDPTVKFDP